METFAGLSKEELLQRVAVISQEEEDRWVLEEEPEGLSSGQRIEQGFILEEGEGDLQVRIRMTTDVATKTTVCTLTVKHKKGGRLAIESNTRIPLGTFNALKSHILPGTGQIKIRRYRGPWIIDSVLEGKHAGSVVAEYEYHDGVGDSIEPPDDFKVKEKLT